MPPSAAWRDERWRSSAAGEGASPPAGDDDVPDWSPLSAVLVLVAAVILGSVGGLLVAAVVGAVLGLNVTSGTLPPGLEITATAVQDAVFVVVAVFVARLGGRPALPAQFGLRTARVWESVGLIIILLVSFYLVTAAWTTALHNNPHETLLNTLGANEGGALLVASALLTCVMAPFCEEFLFRGYIFTALRNWRGPWPAAILTGLVFGLVHGASAPSVYLLPLAFLGFGLCLLYWRTGSLLPGIAAHSINNSIAFAGLEGWPGRDYLLLVAASLGVLAVIGGLMRARGLIVAARPATVAA